MATEGAAPAEREIGKVTHFFSKINVGIIKLSEALRVGERIRFKGHTTDFTQPVASMQIEHASIQTATVGQSIGIRVADHAREHDVVYKVVD